MKCNKGTGIFTQAVKMNICSRGKKKEKKNSTNHMVNRAVSSTLRLQPTLDTDIVQSFGHMFYSRRK